MCTTSHILYKNKVWEVLFMKDDIMPQARLRAHSIIINAREKAVIQGVIEVDSFNEEEIILATDAGMLLIFGEDLHINKLNLDEGQVIINGHIFALEYSDELRRKKSLMSKIFG